MAARKLILLVSLLLRGDNGLAFSSTHQHVGSSSPTALFATDRKPLVTGNWKMNPKTQEQAIALAKDVAAQVTDTTSRDVGIFVPFPFLESVQAAVGDKLFVGAQACTAQTCGAFTGGISPPMLQSIGINTALAGHSERRSVFGESNADINAQCQLLIANQQHIVLCIGETLQEFERNLVQDICRLQLQKGLAGISAADVLKHVTIAYEPIWAIGTGKVATPQIAQYVHATCREILADVYGQEVADQIRILYGGSVTADSVDGLLAQPDIDGALVGGASLDATSFGRIINFQTPGWRQRIRIKASSLKRRIKKRVKSVLNR